MNKRLLLASLVLSAASLQACTTVDSGYGAVEWTPSSGTEKEVLNEGYHMVSPFSQIYDYDLRQQQHQESLQVLSDNGLSIELDTSIIYQPVQSELYALQTEAGPDYYKVLIEPLLRSTARKVVGRYSPEELYSTKREEVEHDILAAMQAKLQPKHIAVDSILIRDVHLPEIVEKAIENKLDEEQQALAMKFVLDKETQEAERKRIQAQGIADYQEIISKTLSPAMLQWRQIQALERLADSPNSKTVILGGEKGANPPIIINPGAGQTKGEAQVPAEGAANGPAQAQGAGDADMDDSGGVSCGTTCR